MDTQTLKNTIKGLKEARDACSSQLDIGALTELNGAIAKLEELQDHQQNTDKAQTFQIRGLQALAAVVSILTNLRDWM